MGEPPAKKARTEAEGEAAEPQEENGEGVDEAVAEAEKPEEAEELEQDAPADKREKIKAKVAIHTQDTTLNLMQSAVGGLLMPLTDGGLQHLFAGARANVGVKSGRYMFEVQVVEVMDQAEDASSRAKAAMPRAQVRLGLSVANSSLFLGDTEESVCFDMEGAFTHNKSKTICSAKFGSTDVVAVVLNLGGPGPNANTVSLFKNGVRASQPQPIPENLVGETLYPAVTFKNVTLHCNFGSTVLRPLPFRCRILQDAAAKDVHVLPAPPQPKDGKYEVLFPVCLPDEGTFDWLDMFMKKHPEYSELSDRAIVAWAEKSGLTRSKSTLAKTSNDKPDMGFGIRGLDDRTVMKVLATAAPLQGRSLIVMEVKANLVKEDRIANLAKWQNSGLRRIAHVVMGEPSADFKARVHDFALAAKQEAANAEFRAKHEEAKQKRALEKQKRKALKEREKTQKRLKKAAAETRRKLEIEKRKKAAALKGEEYNPDEDPEVQPPPEEPEETEEPEEPDEPDEDEPMEEEPPAVTLTPEEKAVHFFSHPTPDLAPFVIGSFFMKFSSPDEDEGFEEIRYEWSKAEACKDHIRNWTMKKKNTTRIEDIVPGEWFHGHWKDWQKTLQTWHLTQNAFKAMIARKKAEKQAREQRLAAIREQKAKQAALKKAIQERKAAEAKRKAEEEGGADVEMKPAEEAEEEAEREEEVEEPAPVEEPKLADVEEVDPFGLDDVCDVGGGMPLFSKFCFEDWAMMTLRFEINILAHSFRKDVKDPDRVGIPLEHLPFYYGKYFKKSLNTKFYGVDTVDEVLDMIKDTVYMCKKTKVVASRVPEELESWNIFAMLTEEVRRDRSRRIDMGEESAKLKLIAPSGPLGTDASPSGSSRLPSVVSARPPSRPAQAGARPAVRPPSTPVRASAPLRASTPMRPAGSPARPARPSWGMMWSG